MSNPMEDIMNSLVASIDRETPDEITYKDFMKATSLSTPYEIFSTYDMVASAPSMIISKMLKRKYGLKRMDDELYWFIREFPVYIDKMSKRIEEEEGSTCCVDKAWSRAMKKLDKLIQKNMENDEKSK